MNTSLSQRLMCLYPRRKLLNVMVSGRELDVTAAEYYRNLEQYMHTGQRSMQLSM